MAIVKDKPEGLPQDEIDTAYVSFSATNIKIENPPALGDPITLVVVGRCTAVGEIEQKDGEVRPKRTITVGYAHHPGRRPVEDPDQGAMFTITADVDGTSVEPSDDAAPDETADDDAPAVDDVAPVEFSHAKKSK